MSGAKSMTISAGSDAVAIGAVIDTVVAAESAELKYHKNAVKHCLKKVNDMLQRAAIKTWATSEEWARLKACQQKLEQIQISDDLVQARAANSQAAERLRDAENATKPARLRVQANEDMRLMLSEGKRPQMLAGQQVLLSKIEQLTAEVSRKNEMNASVEQELRHKQTALREQCQDFKRCVLKFDELADYLDAIKQHDWAENISVAICDDLAQRPDLTVEQIKRSFAQLIKQADRAFEQYRQDNKLTELQNLREETEQRRLFKLKQVNANQFYKTYCQDILLEINELIKKAQHALYNDDNETVKKCLSQFEQLTENLPKTAGARHEQAEQIAEAVAIKQEQMALNLRQVIELSNNLDLPESIQYEISDLDSRMMNLRRAKANEETLKQATKLESEIETWVKRLPILKLHNSMHSLLEVKDWEEDEQEWTLYVETESGEEREFVYILEDDKLKLSMQVAEDEWLTCECRVNANGDISIQKTDDGEGESCAVFKKWRSLIAEVVAVQGLVVKDEQGKIIEPSKQKKYREELQSMAISDYQSH
ncbi:MAG: hypothetical protein ABFS56_20925 [Pseudomonadota bacterium]